MLQTADTSVNHPREKKKPWAVHFDAMQLFSSQAFCLKTFRHFTIYSLNSCASMAVTETLSHMSMISNLAHFLSVLAVQLDVLTAKDHIFFFI